ncbi:hypothetical protein Tco_1029139 [Tanacetum coccineum]|uniref:Reverse transcriptase domain-containing protein n=1 Tax=Tanacetum coccineum TaxID=301880 RepID=A0ABQ5G2L2_9ASTR
MEAHARITEARFEEERFATTIAKANDLNTGVQVQDLELETKVLVDGKQDDVKVLLFTSDRDAEDALSKLLQMGTVAEYQNEFEMLINRVTGISESLLKTFYISGLKPALQCALLRSNPTTLGEAFSLALATEARFTDLQLWELLRSNPTTLGETFFKARITEARFKDEWFTTTIAKANDLNTGVQVQDLELETKVLVDGKQDDVKVVGVAGHQNSDEPNVLKGNGVIGVGMTVSGFWMFIVVKRLKLLKKPLRKLLFDHGNLYDNVKKLRHELDEAQKALDFDPNNVELREKEATYLKAFNDALLLEEIFLVQKAKSQAARNRIDSVTTNTGVCVDGDQVPLAFIDHYTEFFGQQGNTSNFNSINLFCNRLTNEVANHMVRDVSDKEISDAMFSMGNNKAPVPDGVRESLSTLVSFDQSAFVPGRRISDNILLTQELMHNYHLDRGSPRWIMECVTSNSFSLSINGSIHGYFKGKKGLCQGDPMSPYLFTLLMEVLTLMLHRRVRESECFTYHRYCSKLNIINLCFADDLFLFDHGDMDSARVIMDSLDEFKNASGLVPSLPKSNAYFCNVLNYVKLGILNVLLFEKGKLPVKYLSVPLVPSRLLYRDCAELMEKVKRRISDWKNKSLSLTGRVQLIRSVLASMNIYWASVFILPMGLMLDLEQLMRGFSWCQGEMRKGKEKVAWEVACLHRKEGGLGIHRLDDFNKALMSSHIWSLLVLKGSLWVKWVHTYKLNGRTIWEILYVAFAWIDNWCSVSPMADFVSNRDIYSEGFGLSTKVNEIVNDDVWCWSNDWLLRYHRLVNLVVSNLSDADDGLVWRNINNVDFGFSVATTWECIRPRANKVDWFHVV